MIKLTQMNGNEIVVNVDAIEIIEEVPHTIITTLKNTKIIIVESADEVVKKTVQFRQMTGRTASMDK